jgi:hypothetical protein
MGGLVEFFDEVFSFNGDDAGPAFDLKLAEDVIGGLCGLFYLVELVDGDRD